MTRNPKHDVAAWEDLGSELSVARLWILKILCDNRYQALLPKRILGPLGAAVNTIDRVRDRSLERAYATVPGIDTKQADDMFYNPWLPLDDIVSAVRKTTLETAHQAKEEISNA